MMVNPLLITSASNSKLKQLRAALRNGLPDAQDRVRIEGAKLLREAIQSRLPIEEVFVSESCGRDPEIRNLLHQISGRPQVVYVADRLFPSIVSTEHPQGLLALARVSSSRIDTLLAKASMLLVGCEIQDPGNLGTLFRSAEAFGVEGVLLTQTSANPWNEKVIRASAGSIFRVPCLAGLQTADLLRNLEENRFRLVATTPKAAVDFREADYTGRIALILGNEGKGLSDEVLTRVQSRIHIPMTELIESLNVSVAASIILCEAARQRMKPRETDLQQKPI